MRDREGGEERGRGRERELDLTITHQPLKKQNNDNRIGGEGCIQTDEYTGSQAQTDSEKMDLKRARTNKIVALSGSQFTSSTVRRLQGCDLRRGINV